MNAQTSEISNVAPGTTTRRQAPNGLSLPMSRLNLMRAGYLFLAVGLVLTRWPLLLSGEAASLPVFEGVVAAMLAALGLLSLLALRHPVQFMPLLVFESAWKLIWLASVAVPNLVAGDVSDEMRSVLVNVCLVVIVIAVIPWDYAWKRYVRTSGPGWR